MRLVLALFLISISSLAFAQDTDCSDPQTQMAMNVCSLKEFQKADDALNQLWPDVLKYMKEWDKDMQLGGGEYDSRAGALLKAQRAWIDYRDGQCDTESGEYAGGSIRPLIHNTCLAALTQKRVDELSNLIKEH